MNANSTYKVLIAVPAWNEEHCIANVLKEIRTLYPHYDTLVINDGSNDATGQMARKMGSQVIDHNINFGYCAAIQAGRVYALENGYDFLFFVDADGQHRTLDIERIFGPLIRDDADQVRGSRDLGKYMRKEPFIIKIARWTCSTLVSLRTRKMVTDATSGFKGENRKVTKYFKEVYETSKKIHKSNTNDIEEYFIAHKMGFRLMEVPVVMYDRKVGKTKCYTIKNLFKFPSDLIRVVLRNI